MANQGIRASLDNQENLDQPVTKGKKAVLVGQAEPDPRVAVVLRVRLGRQETLDQLEILVSQDLMVELGFLDYLDLQDPLVYRELVEV